MSLAKVHPPSSGHHRGLGTTCVLEDAWRTPGFFGFISSANIDEEEINYD